jgi:tripartite-type tricarboxylate transporter receptor subunit TctC
MNRLYLAALILFLPMAVMVTSVQPTAAQVKKIEYPEKGRTITWIGAFAAGTSPDICVRIVAAGMETELGAPMQVLVKVGANGQIGYTAMAQARPDGYTIGQVVLPGIATIMLDPERGAKFTRDSFQPLAMQVQEPSMYAVLSKSPFKSVTDVVEAAKASPGKIVVATGGLLGDDNLSALYLQKTSGAKFTITAMSEGRVPAFLGGHVDVYVGKTADLLSQIKNGDVRPIGITGSKESIYLPGVKTMQQQGYNFTSFASRGYVVPAGTPKEIVNLLSAAMKKVMLSEDHMKKMRDQALNVSFLDAGQFDNFWKEQEPTIKMLVDLSKEQ